MNEEQLDGYLRQLNDEELRYLANPHYSPYSPNLPSTILPNGKEVFLLDRIGDLPLDKITILKHNRFAPVAMHVHTWIELIYIYSGSCTQIINDEQITLTEGQLCFIDTEVPHAIMETGENDIVINILLSKQMLSTAFLSRLSNKGIVSDFLLHAISEGDHSHYIIFHSQFNKKISRLMREMMCEYFDQDTYYDEIVESYLIIMLTELLRVFTYDARQPHARIANETSLIRILQYIEQHYMSCTLTSTAAHFNYNPSYFSSLIKRLTGKTFNELVRAQKLTYASLLLTKTDNPIYEIASKVGYDNLTFFYRKFKQQYGISPQEYRARQDMS